MKTLIRLTAATVLGACLVGMGSAHADAPLTFAPDRPTGNAGNFNPSAVLDTSQVEVRL